MTRILLVDDHKIIRDGLKSLVSELKEIKIEAEAENGEEAIIILKSKDVDVIILDINMPGKNGIEVTKEIRVLSPDVKILAFSMHDEEEYISGMVEAGANGYLIKTSGQEELKEAIDQVVKKGYYFSDGASEVLKEQLLRRQGGKEQEEPVQLSIREAEVLQLIVEEHTNHEIAEKLFISPRTVDTHRKNLLQKLNAKNTAGLVRKALEKKLITLTN